MSSTNRSNARDSHIADYYVTPIYTIIQFLNEFKQYEEILNQPDIIILDPAAGGDLSHPMSYPKALEQVGLHKIDTIDIREDSLATVKTNYLTYNCKNKYDLIITNPPFNIAIDIIKKALDDVRDNGFVIFLLRLNYFEGISRKIFWDKNMAKYAFIHSKRMTFTDKGGTDSIAYMHCVWQKNYNPKFCQLAII